MLITHAKIETMPIEWKFKEILDKYSITRYALHQEIKDDVSPTTVYRWYSDQPSSVDMVVLGQVIAAMRKLTGEDLNANDFLSFKS